MKSEEREFFEDLVNKVRNALQPDFASVRLHTTETVDDAEASLTLAIKDTEAKLEVKIDNSSADIKKILLHLGL